MIQANTCNDAQDRINDVGGIEPPACSHLHDGDIDRSFREPPESKHAPHFAITDCRFCVLRWKRRAAVSSTRDTRSANEQASIRDGPS